MLPTTVTHYCPWNEPDDVAWCGVALRDVSQHSLTPSCPACARKLAIEEAVEARLTEEAVLPLTDDDARYAGVPVRVPAPSVAPDDIFAYAVHLTRSYAAMAQRNDERRGRRIGGRR